MNTYAPAQSDELREVEIPRGWKYKSLKFGPITLPWYASPESQLILVSFVCFLCPGTYLKFKIYFQDTHCIKACGMLSTAWAVEGFLIHMLSTFPTQRFTLPSLLLVSSPVLSRTPSVLESRFLSAASDIVFKSLHICALSTIQIALAILSSRVYCLDAVQVSSGRRKVPL
jgi:hypothetical protein